MEIKQSTKKCSKCGEIKLLSEFPENKNHKDGRQSYCKKCETKWRYENKEKLSNQKKKYYLKNKEKRNKFNNQWYIDNREYKKEYNKQYHLDHKKEKAEYDKQYRINNPEKLRKSYNEWAKEKYKIDLRYNLNNKMKTAIRLSLQNNKAGRHWETLVGYTLADLIKRLKRTMPKGYNWNDFLEGSLHIDHIIPINAHNFSQYNHIDFQNCWALNNLQLLPAKKNLMKSNKLYRPFQPALQLSGMNF